MQPTWFNDYISQSPVHKETEKDAALIHYQHWPAPGKPGLVLVHGHAAHAHWWDFIAPAFRENFDIIAPDLSGAGDSDHRTTYSARGFAGEILACARDAGLRQPVLVGHSFGGAMTRVAAHLYPDEVAAIIMVDSALPERRGALTPPPMPKRRERIYTSLEAATRRFRLRPPQPVRHPFLVEYIARHSVREVADGWSFKLDTAVFAKMPSGENLPSAVQMVRQMKVPVGFIYGELSRFFPDTEVARLRDLIRPGLLRGVPDAHHHVFLDNPPGFIQAVDSLLERLSPER